MLLHGFKAATNNGLFVVRYVLKQQTSITLWVDTAPLLNREAASSPAQCPMPKAVNPWANLPIQPISLVPPIQPNLVPETEAVIRAVRCPLECMRPVAASQTMFEPAKPPIRSCCSGRAPLALRHALPGLSRFAANGGNWQQRRKVFQ